MVLYLASHPDSNVHIFDVHQKIVLVAVMQLCSFSFWGTIQASPSYMQQRWEGQLVPRGRKKKTPVYTERAYAVSSMDRIQRGEQCRTTAFICINRK
jgi:hypothetical protein